MSQSPRSGKRVAGYDLAKFIAVMGMIVVNYRMVYHGEGGNWLLLELTRFFDGKAAAAFLMVSGAGISLTAQKSRKNGNFYERRHDFWIIIKRALFLLVLGLVCAFIWPGDILFYYAGYLPIAALMLFTTPQRIWLMALAIITGFMILYFMFPYDPDINYGIMDYQGFFRIDTFGISMAYNGYHPVLPWACFVLFGMWLGRQRVHKAAIRRGVMIPAVFIFVVTQLLTTGTQYLQDLKILPVFGEFFENFITNSPAPPLPLFILNAGSAGMILIMICIYLAERFESSRIMRDLVYSGQLWLTIYTAHIIIGIGLPALLGLNLGRLETIEFIWLYSIGFWLLSVVFASFWRRRFKKGPLEAIMRAVSGQN